MCLYTYIRRLETHMITLDVNHLYLAKMFGINTSRINRAGLKTIDEFMEAEALQGNSQAARFEDEVFNSPEQILRLYQLTSPKNRFLILRNMKEEELLFIMQFLDEDVMYSALKFLSQDKLTKMVSELPKAKLATVVFNSFTVEKFLQIIPEKEMNKFFESPKIERTKITKAVDGLDQSKLQGIMESLTGQPCSHCDSREVRAKLGELDDKKFQRAVLAMNPETKAALIQGMTEDNPEYLLEFSTDAMMKPLTQLQKPDFMKCLAVLEPEDYLNMLQELPKDIMPLVCTQIDPDVFAELLSTNFKDILKEISL